MMCNENLFLVFDSIGVHFHLDQYKIISVNFKVNYSCITSDYVNAQRNMLH